MELCAIVIGGTSLERVAIVSFATRDGSATSTGGCGERTNQVVLSIGKALVVILCTIGVS